MKTKRTLAFLAVIVLLAVSLPVTSMAATYATVISFDVLHLRSGPGSEYAIIGKYRNGTRVEILKSGKRWAQVRTPDKKIGYMYMQYLSSFTKTNGNSSSGTGTWTGTRTMYTKSGIGPINFRKQASVNSKLLDQIPGGTMVTVLSMGTTWSRVRYNGTLGWVKSRYLVSSRK